MKRVPAFFATFVIILLLASCEHVRNISPDSCSLSGNYTTINFQNYKVMLFGPNDKRNPDIWEGPVCIENKKKGSVCAQDLSLIKGVKQDEVTGKLIVYAFSGSNEVRVHLDMDSCKIVQSNKL